MLVVATLTALMMAMPMASAEPGKGKGVGQGRGEGDIAHADNGNHKAVGGGQSNNPHNCFSC